MSIRSFIYKCTSDGRENIEIVEQFDSMLRGILTNTDEDAKVDLRSFLTGVRSVPEECSEYSILCKYEHADVAKAFMNCYKHDIELPVLIIRMSTYLQLATEAVDNVGVSDISANGKDEAYLFIRKYVDVCEEAVNNVYDTQCTDAFINSIKQLAIIDER